MQKILISIFSLALVVGLAFAIKHALTDEDEGECSPAARTENQAPIHQRIVSMAPSVTEILFALGLGDSVVGVTTYCDYPPAVASIKKVGGLYPPNHEAVAALAPDIVIALRNQEVATDYRSTLGLNVLEVDHDTLAGVKQSITAIGRACGRVQAAQRMFDDLEARVSAIERATAGLDRPRVLMVVERDVGSDSVSGVYVAAQDGFYDSMLRMAGATNAYRDAKSGYVKLSAESILHIDPEIIIDIVPDLHTRGLQADALIDDWRSVSSVEAVIRGRVFVLGDTSMVRPGPRFILIVETLARLIHPNLDWER
jgi:iron complex transport system substrate-binding protein